MIIFQDPQPHLFSPVKIAFLTGLSNPNSNALSTTQKTFLSRLDYCEAAKVYQNFPYINTSASIEKATTFVPEIITTSFANIKQYFQASSQAFSTAARSHLTQLAASTKYLILLVGSCGLEILNHALTADIRKKLLHVFAYGPVARHLPDVSHTLIQGSRDYISQTFFRPKNIPNLKIIPSLKVIPNLGHLAYLENDLVFDAINQELKSKLSTI